MSEDIAPVDRLCCAPAVINIPSSPRSSTHLNPTVHFHTSNQYYEPRYSGFRDLVVTNEDAVTPGKGFPTHGHRDMEIISYVTEGQLSHRDSTGISLVIRSGDVQRMSAGTGVRHSEFKPSETELTHFLQIWTQPERDGLAPSYEQRTFPAAERRGRVCLVALRTTNNVPETYTAAIALMAALPEPHRHHGGGRLTVHLVRHAPPQPAPESL